MIDLLNRLRVVKEIDVVGNGHGDDLKKKVFSRKSNLYITKPALYKHHLNLAI